MGGGGRPSLPVIEEESPAPTIMGAEETDEAKQKAKKRARTTRGREATILAGRMMTERQSTSALRQILGA